MKRTVVPLKRKAITHKPKSEEQVREEREQRDKMWELFEQHWNSKPHICEQCTVKIYGENKSLYHHHLLEKGIEKYKDLKYEIDNLMLLCSDCHTSVTNGFGGDKVIKRTQEAKEKYEII